MRCLACFIFSIGFAPQFLRSVATDKVGSCRRLTPDVEGTLLDEGDQTTDSLHLLQRKGAYMTKHKEDVSALDEQGAHQLSSMRSKANISTADRETKFVDQLLIGHETSGNQVIYEKSMEILVEDPSYISFLKKVGSYYGGNLYSNDQNKSFSSFLHLVGPQAQYWKDHFEFNFPNNALFLWGSNKSSILYVFAPGTNALCVNYGATLSYLASTLGVLAVCPQFVSNPNVQESVMKPACAVEWALSWGNFTTVIVGGHSGGASAVPATARVLINKGIKVDAMIMQHPGVTNMNVPGCASSAPFVDWQAYCSWYFPNDLMTQVSSAKLMLITGNFCEWTKVQNSNFLSLFGCNPDVLAGTCSSMTFPTPSIRPAQPPVTCHTGTCPDASYLLNPGDCMVNTHGAGSVFYTPFNGTSLHVNTCSEHEFGTTFQSGLIEEGKPYLGPYLKYVITDNKTQLDSIIARNGTNITCEITVNSLDMCVQSVSPYTASLNPLYSENGTLHKCKDAPKRFASGPAEVQEK